MITEIIYEALPMYTCILLSESQDLEETGLLEICNIRQQKMPRHLGYRIQEFL